MRLVYVAYLAKYQSKMVNGKMNLALLSGSSKKKTQPSATLDLGVSLSYLYNYVLMC